MLLFRIVLLYEGIQSNALYPEDTSPSSAVTGRETKLGKVTNLPPPLNENIFIFNNICSTDGRSM